MSDAGFVATFSLIAVLLVIYILTCLHPDADYDRAYRAAANIVTFGWHHRLEQSRTSSPAACTHWKAVPCRESMTDEIVAWLCPNCDKQLDERPPLAVPPPLLFVPDPRLTARIKE